MLYKNRKMTQTEVDEIYEDFVIEIATKVARQVKGKVFYGNIPKPQPRASERAACGAF